MNQNGAPTLMSGPAPLTDLQLATAATDTRLQAAPSEWGIYLNGKKEIEPDSILALEYDREWAIADFPIEGGGFASYDKVARPFDVRLRLTKSSNTPKPGGVDLRTFLAAIENLSDSLKLVDVVTPDRTYLSVTISRLGYTRTATSGAGLLTVDVGLREVRVTAGVAFTGAAVKNPGSADTVSSGTVQPQAVPAATQAEIKAAVAQRRAEIDANMFSTPAY